MNTLLFSALLLQAAYAPEPRSRISMDPGWRFSLGNAAGAEQPKFNDRAWRLIDVPHDWSVEGTPVQDAPGGGRVGFFPTGTAWYRKSFRVPQEAKGKLTSIEFDGVYMNAEVWINGVRLGQRPFGYIGFSYDLTPHLVSGTNVIAVRVDNSAQPNSRWYTGSGIYRHVWLTVTDRVHFDIPAAAVTTPEVTNAQATIVLALRVIGATTPGRLRLRTTLVAPDGTMVSTDSMVMGADGFRQTVQVHEPHLWSVDDPALYSLLVELLDGNRLRDLIRIPVGLRTAVFDKDRGFLLNGTQVKLRGVNLHHEAGALGAAVPEQVWESRLRALKAMGVNAIRTSHNPPAPEFMDLCDRLGFLVMAEVFDEWTLGKVSEGYHKYFQEWSERDVVDFVRRDRNHPSIVLWSAGNEIGEQSAPNGVAVLQRLLDIFHREDPTRPVTTGNDQIVADGSPAKVEFLDALDVVGYNYVDRWHERREVMAEQDRHDRPDWKMVGTESGSIFQSFEEQYSLGNDPKVIRPNYTSGMFQVERLWKWITVRNYFSGNFMWTGFDYLGESSWPFKGFPSGALDITGEPKDAFYLYQSLWSSEPVLRLFPHWNWPGREGQVIPVLAYTNCNTVELFLNGRSLGEQRKEFPSQGTSGGWNSYALPVIQPTTADLHFRWDVPYEPGVLRAVGRKRDGSAGCGSEVKTAGAATAIVAAAERSTITTARGDVAMVRVQIVDANGVLVPMANDRFCVAVTGGRVAALDNGNLQDLEPYRLDCRKAFNGRGLIVVRPGTPGRLTVIITAPGLTTGEATIHVVRGNSQAIVPAVAQR